MTLDPNQAAVIGSQTSDTLEGGAAGDVILGRAGDDTIMGQSGDDALYGDFADTNLLEATEDAISFAQYGDSDAWSVAQEAGGHQSMTQSVETLPGEVYSISFDVAANYGSGTVSGAVEVLWNGEVIGSFDTNSAAFSAETLQFEGIEGVGDLTFRSIEPAGSNGPQIDTSGPIFHYDATVQIAGEAVTVKAFAEAQANLYQVINGTLQVFDVETQSYTQAGVNATVTTNAIGFNVQDNLIYGIAVGNGVDSLGNAVSSADLMMIDATGASFRVGETPYRSWTGDFDANGNLWAFQSSMDRVTRIDVDQVDANGNVLTETFKFPGNMITDQLWDVAFDAASNSFLGVTRPSSEGAPTLLYQINISAVPYGGEPTFETTQIVGTIVDGAILSGVPAVTFGGAIQDAAGTLFVAGNSGDHDMNDATAKAGGIYKVVTNADSGLSYLELISDSPTSRSNDGAADPRAADPFADVDREAAVLIKSPTLTLTDLGDNSFDDAVSGGAGNDAIQGGLGQDLGEGQRGNDSLQGQTGDDRLFGGNAVPTQPPRDETYDAVGNRYDANGLLLPEDNDVLSGGAGLDYLHGGAGHDTLDGGTQADMLIGGSGFDLLYGGTGDDALHGGSERDVMHGGDGADLLVGSYGTDDLHGDAGNDTLKGGSENDTLDGGLGNDLLQGGVGDDLIFGAAGADTLEGSTGDDILIDTSGANLLSGGSGHDTLEGGSQADTLDGGSGNDVLSGGEGRDQLKGGTGHDVLNGGGDKDKLYGGSGDDTIDGGAGSDYINAASGDDVIDAGQGRDKILMGAGADAAYGGEDRDWFMFNARDLDGAANIIFDFTHTAAEGDRLDFRALSLVSDAQGMEAWIASHVTRQQDNDVLIRFDAFELTLVDHAGRGADFYAQVIDGMEMF